MTQERKRPGASGPDSKDKTSESPAPLYRDFPFEPILTEDRDDLDPFTDWDRPPVQLELNFGGVQ